MELGLFAIFAALLVYQTVTNYIDRERHFKEKADLLNRFMARNFDEYAHDSKVLEAKPINSAKAVELENEIRLQELKEAQDIYEVQ